jgi:hypothetical protein
MPNTDLRDDERPKADARHHDAQAQSAILVKPEGDQAGVREGANRKASAGSPRLKAACPKKIRPQLPKQSDSSP